MYKPNLFVSYLESTVGESMGVTVSGAASSSSLMNSASGNLDISLSWEEKINERLNGQ